MRFIAVTELLLIFPAVLFMTALLVRNFQPAPYEPAASARRLVGWFAARPLLGLDVLLIALPFAALLIGGVTALNRWSGDAGLRQAARETLAAVHTHLDTLIIAAATLTAGGILAIVALHMITD